MNPPDIFGAAFAADPYPHYRIMRDVWPLYRHQGANAYIISRYDDVCAALRNPDFTTRSYAAQIEPLLGVTLVQREGREHASERRRLAGAVRSERFQAMLERSVAEVAERLIDDFRHRGEVELISGFITPFAVQVLAAMIGLPSPDQQRFRSWYAALLRFGINLANDPAIACAGLAARDELRAYLRPLVATQRQRPGPDLLSLLAETEIDGQRLTDDEIVRSAMLMVFAGGETIEATLATFIRNLVAHPASLVRVRDDRSLMDRALAESLRYTAPTHMVPRRTRTDAAVSGGGIPAEAEVLCFLAAANRDERRFANPDVFDIDRAGSAPDRAFTAAAGHTAFGAGRHFCLGAMLAKLEVTLAANRLLDAMPGLRFPRGMAPPDQGLFLRSPRRLDLCFNLVHHTLPTRARRPEDPCCSPVPQ